MTTAHLVRRIVIALDASPHSRAALELAARLAAWEQAELCGIYVEDINLLRLADHPMAREIDPLSAAPHAVSARQVERQLKRLAADAERALAASADKQRVRWTFRVERGSVTTAILDAAAKADLVALGRAGGGTIGPGRMGSTARAITTSRRSSVLVLQPTVTQGRPVVTLFDDTASSKQSLTAALQLSERLEVPLVLLIPATTAEAGRALAKAAETIVGGHPTATVRARTLVGVGPATMLRAIRQEQPALCVIGTETSFARELAGLVADELHISLYLVAGLGTAAVSGTPGAS